MAVRPRPRPPLRPAPQAAARPPDALADPRRRPPRVDNRIDTEGEELFSRDLELRFGDAYDKLLRASEGLDLARDLVASVRDYHQAKVANDQNEVMKRLTVVASVLLVPTFIVGLYGQNLRGMPGVRAGSFGYWWSWFLIIVTTIGQIIYYRRKGWI